MRSAVARACRETRIALRLTQRQLAATVRVSRGYIAAIERGRANPSVDVVDRICRALELEAELIIRPPIVMELPRQHDLVHARCIAYVERRLQSIGWTLKREVEVVQARSHGWIDLMACHPESETLLVVEVKTRLDDLGSVERQIGWYGRSAAEAARRIGWRPRRIVAWLLVLASDEVERTARDNRDLLSLAFPVRAPQMLDWLSAGAHPTIGRGLAMVDPSSKRRDWLIRLHVDGRRSPARYAGYGDAARSLTHNQSPSWPRRARISDQHA